MTVLLKKEEFPPILHTMITNPECISHMLFVGPPGSGKTTTAQSFAMAIHGKTTNSFSSLLFLNSSDERSLDMIRNKIYPFVESRMQSLFFTSGKVPPKVIIFDEAETLTDQAQCALRPLLQKPTSEIIIIFICNSLSHIHPQILNKFLLVPFVPTDTGRLQSIVKFRVPALDSLFRRGDIRFFKQCSSQNTQITRFLSKILHVDNEDTLFTLLTEPGTPIRDRVTWFLLLLQYILPISKKDVNLWSSITSSETQAYIPEKNVKKILYSLWQRAMIAFMKEMA
jgi:energy-coupling factor transporter ATP-binding protein EcfA2